MRRSAELVCDERGSRQHDGVDASRLQLLRKLHAGLRWLRQASEILYPLLVQGWLAAAFQDCAESGDHLRHGRLGSRLDSFIQLPCVDAARCGHDVGQPRLELAGAGARCGGEFLQKLPDDPLQSQGQLPLALQQTICGVPLAFAAVDFLRFAGEQLIQWSNAIPQLRGGAPQTGTHHAGMKSRIHRSQKA